MLLCVRQESRCAMAPRMGCDFRPLVIRRALSETSGADQPRKQNAPQVLGNWGEKYPRLEKEKLQRDFGSSMTSHAKGANILRIA